MISEYVSVGFLNDEYHAIFKVLGVQVAQCCYKGGRLPWFVATYNVMSYQVVLTAGGRLAVMIVACVWIYERAFDGGVGFLISVCFQLCAYPVFFNVPKVRWWIVEIARIHVSFLNVHNCNAVAMRYKRDVEEHSWREARGNKDAHSQVVVGGMLRDRVCPCDDNKECDRVSVQARIGAICAGVNVVGPV